MNAIIRKIVSLRKEDKINGGVEMLPIRKINTVEKNIMEQKKMQEIQNKIIGQRNNIGLAKGITHDIRKRQFIRKGILGIIAGIGIAIFSKVTRAATGGINFYGEQDAEIMDSSKGVMKFWAEYEQTGAHSMTTSYNMTSITDGGAVGDSDFVIANDMDSTNYGMVAGGVTDPRMPLENVANRLAGSFTMISRIPDSNTGADGDNLKVIGFGRLA